MSAMFVYRNLKISVVIWWIARNFTKDDHIIATSAASRISSADIVSMLLSVAAQLLDANRWWLHISKAVFDYAILKPVSDLGFSVQIECTKPLTNRY